MKLVFQQEQFYHFTYARIFNGSTTTYRINFTLLPSLKLHQILPYFGPKLPLPTFVDFCTILLSNYINVFCILIMGKATVPEKKGT